MKANDGKCVIAMSSMTYALKAEQLLKSSGMQVRVVKLAQGRTARGCAYGLELSCAQAHLALLRLEESSIKHGELLR